MATVAAPAVRADLDAALDASPERAEPAWSARLRASCQRLVSRLGVVAR
jgi:hypothetical protein